MGGGTITAAIKYFEVLFLYGKSHCRPKIGRSLSDRLTGMVICALLVRTSSGS